MSGQNTNTGFSKFLGKIGRCGTCMRQSFAAVTLAWAAFAAIQLLQLGEALNRAALILAISFSLLWLCHATIYVFRALGMRANTDRGGVIATSNERRDALAVLVRSAAAALIVSTPIVLWSSRASAFCGQCTKNADCGTCRCVNTAPVNSGKVCNECVCP
jgi:hypothetical protein